MSGSSPQLNLVVLISGSGSNLQSLIDATKSGSLNARITAVISNRADAFGLTRAKQAGIAHAVLSHQDYAGRSEYDAALGDLIEKHQPDLVVLAGFMRILSAEFVTRFRDRILNIHPALLPKFKGMDTHQRAIDAGETEHGATVHLVTEELDGGPVLLQAVVPVLAGDIADVLQQRVLKEEHRIYPEAIEMLARGELTIENGKVMRTQPAKN